VNLEKLIPFPELILSLTLYGEEEEEKLKYGQTIYFLRIINEEEQKRILDTKPHNCGENQVPYFGVDGGSAS